jgi:hypothetical protein
MLKGMVFIKKRILQAMVLVFMVFFMVYNTRFSHQTTSIEGMDLSQISTFAKIDIEKSFYNMSNYGFISERNFKNNLSALVFGNKNDITLEIFKECYIGDYQIPGILYSLGCIEMIPQGLAIMDDRLLITEYCASGEHNSLIQIIDKNNGKFVKTVKLPSNWHVGGVCYDGEYVYITSNQDTKNKTSFVAVFDKEDLLTLTSINPIDNIEIPLKSNAFVCYNEYADEVYVGGYILNSFLKDDIVNISTMERHTYTSFMQDMDFVENDGIVYTLISRSSGSANSSLDFWKDGEKVFTIAMPPFMEGIAIDRDNDILYCSFESSADKYINSTDIPIDKILLLDLNKIFDFLEKEL